MTLLGRDRLLRCPYGSAGVVPAVALEEDEEHEQGLM